MITANQAQPQAGEVFLDASSVAQMLKVSVARVYQLWRNGLLPSVRLGRQLRMTRQQLENFVAQGGKGL